MVTEAMVSLAITQLWQLTAVVLVVAVLARFTARRCPQLAVVLWIVVLAKCLTPPLWSSPSGVFCWWQPHRETAVASLPTVASSERLSNESQVTAVAVSALPGSARAADKNAATGVLIPQATSDLDVPPSPAIAWHLMCLTAWVSSVAVWLVFSAWRWRVCWRRICRETRSAQHNLQLAVDRLANRLRIRRPVRVLVTGSRVGPAVCGIFRPTIVLPEVVLTGKPLRDLEPILAHELLHVRRGDLPLGLLQTLVQAVWWFHPGIWWVNRALSRDLERCCDEQVLAELGCDPSHYAHSLLEILERKRMLTPVPLVPGVRPVEVTSERLERIMKLGQGCRRRSPWWCWLVLLFAGALMLPGAAWVAGDENQSPRPAADRAVDRVAGSDDAAAVAPEVIRVYNVHPVMIRVQDQLGIGPDQGRTQLTRMLSHMVGSKAGEPALQISWHRDWMVASHSQPGHERLAAALEYLKQLGVERVLIEARVIRGPSDAIRKLNDRWSVLGVSANSSSGEANSPNQAGADGGERGSVSMTVEKRSPVVFATLTEQQVDQLISQAEDEPGLRFEVSPQVMTMSGREASIFSGVQRPFVVGVHREGNTALQPEMRIVQCGWKLQLLPVVVDQSQLRLDCVVSFSEVLGVEEQTIVTGPEPPLKLQVPEVRSVRMEAALQLQSGQPVLIGGMTAHNDEGQLESVLVMLNCSRVESPIDDQPIQPTSPRLPARSADPQPLPDLAAPPQPQPPQPAARRRPPSISDAALEPAVAEPPLPTSIEPWPTTKPTADEPQPLEATPSPPVRKPGPPTADQLPTAPLPKSIGRQLRTAGIRWQIDGASRMHMTENMFELEAEQIQLEIPTQKGTQLLVRAEQARILSDGDRLTVRLDGNVQLESQDGTRLSGAKAELRFARHGDDSYTLEFHGLR